MNIKIIAIIIFFILLLIILYKNEEKYGGALVQLYSKGPQDRYLTNDDYIYMPYNPVYPYYGYYGYTNKRSPFLWNEPTRIRFNTAPYVMLSPDRYSPYYIM